MAMSIAVCLYRRHKLRRHIAIGGPIYTGRMTAADFLAGQDAIYMAPAPGEAIEMGNLDDFPVQTDPVEVPDYEIVG